MNKIICILIIMMAVQFSCYAELKIGVVNVEKIFMSYERTQDSDKLLRDKKEEKQKRLTDYEEKVKKMKDELDANKDNYTEERRKKESDKLNEEIQNLQKLLQKYSQELQGYEGEMINEIKDEILDAIKKIAKDEKKDIILEKTAILYGGDDITEKVIVYINDLYKKKK